MYYQLVRVVKKKEARNHWIKPWTGETEQLQNFGN